MTFAFPAYHQEHVTLPNVVTHELIEYACRATGFTRPFYTAGPQGAVWRCTSSISLWSWGEQIAITWLGPNQLHIRSECSFPTQCIDWGRNETNVRKLAAALLGSMAQPQLYR